MAVFEWRRRSTKNFGEVLVPFAEVILEGQNARRRKLALQVDSGAVVSLLRRSVADLLGVCYEDGQELKLSSVSGGATLARLHEVRTSIDDNICLPVPYAIADSEDAPNLLGRLGVFDQLQVDFDPRLQETTLSAAWLSPDLVRIWRFVLDTDRHIHDRWGNERLPGRGDQAAARLLQRGSQLMAAIIGLLKLHQGFECPALMRSLLELAMQFEYLLADPASRSEQYLEFEHVTRYEQLQAIVNAPKGTIARFIARSSDRLSGESRLKTRYDSVKSRFLRKRGGTWSSWYCMTVRDLARRVGRLPEYLFWYKMCSGWTHADPFAALKSRMFDDAQVFVNSTCYYGRMLLGTADAKKIVLTGEQHAVLQELERGVI